jgi:hypothetical protein
MIDVARQAPQYDAFLCASLGEDDELRLDVLSMLTRQELDPLEEAGRLARLSLTQAINSLASKIWKSNSERWSPAEASILAIRLIQLLPSHGGAGSSRRSAEDDDRMTAWLAAGMPAASIAAAGDGLATALERSDPDGQADLPRELSPSSARRAETN